jgi:6-phosphogluconate dehydrogenase
MNNPFGLIGLAVMGQNLVLNVESRGFGVSVFNRSPEVTEAFVAAHPGKRLYGARTLQQFVASLERPRKIMLMVKAGAAVDAVIEQLIPLLDKDDIVIDGGNSLYTDTERRDAWLTPLGLRFVGAGVSGGEEGARKGPSIMPGGPASTWAQLKPIFERIAAQVEGQPCVMHIGPGGAGHYVKMVHNGIEYGDMQLICEAYALFKAAGMGSDEMADIFDGWNQGDLQSYLIQITAKALRQRDPETAQPVVDLILDKAGQKGTGQWTLMNAADNAVVVSTINAAVEARVLSSMKAARVVASKVLHASKVISYAQGLDLMHTMSLKKDWQLDLGGIASIWRGGCIIRARFLGHITQAYRADPALSNLMLAPFFQGVLSRSQQAWREVVALAVSHGIPVPAMSASLGYYDSYRSARLPANLLQAQRDFFGAHTYERVDKPAGQWFHTAWPEVIG